jgi:DNA polymerase-3 subunit gamma/tau
MLPTVLSRCLQFNLRPMAPATVREHLRQVLAAEGVPHDDGSLRLLSRAARGSMRDGLSLTDQAIAYGGGQLAEGVVRAMLGSVDRSHARTLVEALARRDGAAVLAAVDGLRSLGLSAAGTLEEIALLLQQMAIEQAVPGALDTQEPEAAEVPALAGLLAPDETQLLYSMVLHGREELGLMSDEYGALTMVLLRFLAFPSTGGGAGTRAAAAPPPPAREPPVPPRVAPLRAPAPPALNLPATPPADTAPAAARTAPADPALGDRWAGLVQRLCDKGAVAALVRELAVQAGLRAIDASAVPPRWHLVVERETLRSPFLSDRLAAAMADELRQPLAVSLEPGVPDDSPARREAAERLRRQAVAEEAIRNDPVVRELMAQFKGARIVPGSIKPV